MLCNQSRKEPASNYANVDACLMDSHGSRPGGLAVIVAEHGHRGRIIHGLAQSLRATEEQQLAEIARKGCSHADQTPRLKAGQNGRLSSDAVYQISCERC